jgi:hypothetical protein
MERACGKNAIYDAIEKGASYPIDVQGMVPILPEAGVEFRSSYLWDVLRKYYG